jgi:tRNA pseudouridine55 synthase
MDIIDKKSEFPNLRGMNGSSFLVNKPKKWTSFDVVKKLRFAFKRVYDRKKYKVGHAGTLDPLAEGLLIVCAGANTKKIDSFQNLNKEYKGVIKLGATTASYDAEFPEENNCNCHHITTEDIETALIDFTGTIKQRPPVFSAVKKSGKKLYQYARKGEEVEIPERSITIFEIEATEIHVPFVSFRMICSKGTYVRSFASDLGEELGVGGYLYDLKRTKIGAYSVSDAYEVQEIFDMILKQVESR